MSTADSRPPTCRWGYPISRPLRLGVVILPELRWPAGRERWQRAEQLGFDHAWTYDHLAWRSLRDEPWFDMVPTLAAAALATTRIRVGPLVASPNFRHPVAFARELITLDDLSGGRLTVGIGSGGLGWDATMLGQAELSTSDRAERFEEFVGLLDQLLREPTVSHRGRWYVADEARTAPGCVQRPRAPFAVAGIGPRGMRLAALHGDTWVTTGDRRPRDEPLDAVAGAALIAGQIVRLEEACAEVSRDPATLRRLVVTGVELDPHLASPEAFRDTCGRYAEAGATDLVVHWPRSTPPYAGDEESFERAVAGS